MGSSRRKTAVLARLEEERALLEATVASLAPERMGEPGVVGEWSVKDVLAHLADWEEHMLVWVEASRRGERVSGPDAGLSWSQLKEFNRRIHELHRSEQLDGVLDWFRTAHARFMEMVAAMPEDEMLKRGRYALTGKQAIYDWLLQYAAHDAWGRRRIAEWLQAGMPDVTAHEA